MNGFDRSVCLVSDINCISKACGTKYPAILAHMLEVSFDYLYKMHIEEKAQEGQTRLIKKGRFYSKGGKPIKPWRVSV
jgi:hypothetical protein